jgi:dCTP deaminase
VEGTFNFSVYNAGPSDVVLEKGNPFALIWYADLDRDEADDEQYEHYFKKQSSVMTITSDKVSDMSGDIFSPFKLKRN